MQSFALSRRIGEIESCEVEIIDYMSFVMDMYYKLFTIYRGKNGIFKIKDRITMYKAFVNGINKLPLSESRLVSDNEEKFYKFISDKYDIIVVGSDAVWNYEKRGLPNPYFLMKPMSTKKLSYAASCNGINYENITEEKLKILKKSFSQFDYLGVRDTLTEKLVERALGSGNTNHNCDPTLLLDFDKDGLGDKFVKKLVAKLQKKYKWDTRKKHIGLMLSNLNGNLAKTLVDNIRKKYGNEYQIVSVYSYCPYADIPYISDLTPFEWSRIFSLFEITFSKYFHGTILSILNETPVISLSAERHIEGIPAKVEDILGRMNLMEFYWPAKSCEEIDWNKFMDTVDRFIKNPPTDKMKSAIKAERKYAESFFEYMKNI